MYTMRETVLYSDVFVYHEEDCTVLGCICTPQGRLYCTWMYLYTTRKSVLYLVYMYTTRKTVLYNFFLMMMMMKAGIQKLKLIFLSDMENHVAQHGQAG